MDAGAEMVGLAFGLEAGRARSLTVGRAGGA